MILEIFVIFGMINYYPNNPKHPKYLKDPITLFPLPFAWRCRQ